MAGKVSVGADTAALDAFVKGSLETCACVFVLVPCVCACLGIGLRQKLFRASIFFLFGENNRCVVSLPSIYLLLDGRATE